MTLNEAQRKELESIDKNIKMWNDRGHAVPSMTFLRGLVTTLMLENAQLEMELDQYSGYYVDRT